jgi:hypothetical protein
MKPEGTPTEPHIPIHAYTCVDDNCIYTKIGDTFYFWTFSGTARPEGTHHPDRPRYTTLNNSTTENKEPDDASK